MDYLAKYFPQNRDHLDRTLFPGVNGFQYRDSVVPNLKQHEVDQLPLQYDAHTEIFDLSKPEDIAKYNSIIDGCAKGLCMLRADDKVYDPDTKSWRVLCQWFDVYLTDKDKDRNAKLF